MKPEDFEQKMQGILKKLSSPSFTLFPFMAPKKLGESGLEYASFSGRMFAMTVDMMLLTILLLPFFQWASALMFPHYDQEQAIGMVLTAMMGMAENRLTVQEAYVMVDSAGAIDQAVFNSLLQVLVTGLVIVPVWNRTATTPGLWLLGMYIADADSGGKPTLRQYVLRYIGVLLATLPLMSGMIWMVFDKRGQGWQDKMANTVVIRKPRDWRWWKKKTNDAA